MEKQERFSWFAFTSIIVGCIVFSLKFLAYKITNSAALYSDWLESFINIVLSVVSIIAIYMGTKPPDYDHCYGHYKIEYIFAGVEAIIIISVACSVIYYIFHYLYALCFLKEVPSVTHVLAGVGINILSSAINGIWVVFLLKEAKRAGSPALKADGWHLLSDIGLSLGVVIAVMVSFLTQIPILDPLIGLVAACLIFVQGIRLMSDSVNGLMDHSLTLKDLKLIKKIILENGKGALEFHDLKTRSAGRIIFIEFHLVVPKKMEVGDAHDICDRIEAALTNSLLQPNVVIHLEPEDHIGTTKDRVWIGKG